MRRYLPTLLSLLCISASLFSQIDHWETVITYGDTCRYFPGTSEPDSNWRKLGFNDSAWAEGPQGVGFSDGDDATTITKVNSIYSRIHFNVVDTSKIAQAVLNIDYDDGWIAFLNNVEIARSNLGAVVGDHPPYNQYANGQHEAQMYQGGNPEAFIVTKDQIAAAMINGANVFAIQIHNATANSPDITCNVWFSFGMTDSTQTYGSNPSWFVAPFSDSNLPIIVINTGGQTIVDDPRIVCDMGIIYNGPGIRNYLSDPFNDYDGLVDIEIRGSSSQQYPKKSYGFETQDSAGNNLNTQLLGMPKENDWILYAPYPDKTMIRNVMTYDIFERMGHWSPRTRYCELLINGEYKGVYVLLEKIKRDGDRVDVPKLEPDDLAGDSLTGGYVFKVDKTTGTGGQAWTSPYSQKVWYQFHDPDDTELLAIQRNYLEGIMDAFEIATNGSNFADPDLGYRQHIDVNSFIDFLLMQELGRTVDGYRSSSFMHKTRDSKGGLIRMGPMWDFNLSYGNANYCDAYDTTGWQYNFNSVCSSYDPEVPWWWGKLMTDPAFANDVRCRWDYLRQDILSTTRLHNYVDSVAQHLNEGRIRNFERWPIIGVYVNWIQFVGQSYQEDLDYFKWWIQSRSAWMDLNLPGSPATCAIANEEDLVITEINYNSDTANNAGDWFELYNAGTDTIDLSRWIFKDDNPTNSYMIPAGTKIGPGEYLVLVHDSALFSAVHPGVQNFIGEFGFNLSNAGGGIRLYNLMWMEVLSMEYDDDVPWPTTPDGGGTTLEIDSISGDLNDPTNWFAGCPKGSPGQAYFTPCTPVARNRQIPGDAKLTIAPNPFEETTTIYLPAAFCQQTEPFTIEVISMAGQRVWKKPVKNTCEITFKKAQIPAGIYFVRAKSQDGLLVTGKMAIQ